MPLIHVGIRPTHRVVCGNDIYEAQRGYRYEKLPEGGHRLWTARMLRSGCNNEVSGDKTMGDLLYCENCGEFFSRNQFKEGESL